MKTRLFQVIDLDRTLFDTSAFVKAITDELDKTEPGLGTTLDEKFEQAYKNEVTFFLLRYLRREKGDVWFGALVKTVIARYGAESFMLPGARERLSFAETLGEQKPAWGILTYGDEIDQLLKLRIAGLEDVPLIIAKSPDKGVLIATWRQPDGSYKLPEEFGGGVVDELSFEDDKIRAFQGLPENASGIWITNDAQASQKISDNQLKNVQPADGLIASMDILRAKYL